jgi:C1A family cysteine protease
MKYGYRPDPPSSKDRNFSTELAPRLQVATSGDVDLRRFCTVQNQYDIGSCAGNSTADSVEIISAIEGRPPVQLSRLFVYTLARNLMDADGDGKGDIDKDEGVYIRLCFDVLSKFGICREDIPAGKGGWPYDTKKVHTLPDILSMRAATGHRIHSYYRISETGEARIQKMLAALRANHVVVFGTRLDKNFQDVKDETPWMCTGETLGGHAMVVVGYLSGLGFIVKNSWGPSWGSGGFCIMKPEVFLSSSNTQDLWVPTMGTSFKS